MSDEHANAAIGGASEESSKINPESQSTSNSSSGQPSRQQSVRGSRSIPKSAHKVKFSVEQDQEGEDGPDQVFPNQNLPEIRLQNSEDVTDHTQAPFDWAGRTNAAAAYAQGRASRLANKLSNSTGASRAQSGSNTPLITPPQG